MPNLGFKLYHFLETNHRDWQDGGFSVRIIIFGRDLDEKYCGRLYVDKIPSVSLVDENMNKNEIFREIWWEKSGNFPQITS